jgi:hypothetical protein
MCPLTSSWRRGHDAATRLTRRLSLRLREFPGQDPDAGCTDTSFEKSTDNCPMLTVTAVPLETTPVTVPTTVVGSAVDVPVASFCNTVI